MKNEPSDTHRAAWQPAPRGWIRRFADAFRGIGQGMAGQVCFVVHWTVAVLVIVVATLLQISTERWCLLILCIGIVLAAELFNSSLELVCRSITRQHDPNIGRALNVASGGVLTVALTAAIVGSLVFFQELWTLWS